jgi:hypothetical protein
MVLCQTTSQARDQRNVLEAHTRDLKRQTAAMQCCNVTAEVCVPLLAAPTLPLPHCTALQDDMLADMLVMYTSGR